MKRHDYTCPAKGHYYCEIRGSEFLSGEGDKPDSLNLLWVSDGPAMDDITEFIEKEYPELVDKKIKFVYSGPSLWMCEWDEKPVSASRSVSTVVFEKEKV